MKLTQQQLKALAEALENLNAEETNEAKTGDGNAGPTTEGNPGSQGATEQANQATGAETQRSQQTPERAKARTEEATGAVAGAVAPRVKLGTPSKSNILTEDSLNGKSVEWMAANLDEVNKLIEVN